MKTLIEPMRFSQAATPFGGPSKPSGPPLAPLLAGSRARGVADGLEWLGVAAVLLDDRGEVLHANSGAVELMGEELFIQAGRLRARATEVDSALSDAIREALTSGTPTTVPISLASGQGPLAARIAAIDSLEDDPFQLLRIIAILDRSGLPSRERGGQTH